MQAKDSNRFATITCPLTDPFVNKNNVALTTPVVEWISFLCIYNRKKIWTKTLPTVDILSHCWEIYPVNTKHLYNICTTSVYWVVLLSLIWTVLTNWRPRITPPSLLPCSEGHTHTYLNIYYYKYTCRPTVLSDEHSVECDTPWKLTLLYCVQLDRIHTSYVTKLLLLVDAVHASIASIIWNESRIIIYWWSKSETEYLNPVMK